MAPKGLPTCLSFSWGEEGEASLMVVLRRKSWVTAMPMEAKEREVRSQARKVRSVLVLASISWCTGGCVCAWGGWYRRYRTVWKGENT